MSPDSYYNARYYDPVIGRFTQPDTIVPGAADPQNLNRYSYVRNNPVKYVDPTGHCYGLSDGDAAARCVQAYQAAEVATARAAVPAPGAPPPTGGSTGFPSLAGAIPSALQAAGFSISEWNSLSSVAQVGDWAARDDGRLIIEAGGTRVVVDDALATAVRSTNVTSGQVFRAVSDGLPLIGISLESYVIWSAWRDGDNTGDSIDRAGRAVTSTGLTALGMSQIVGSASCTGAVPVCVAVIGGSTVLGPPVYDHVLEPWVDLAGDHVVGPVVSQMDERWFWDPSCVWRSGC